ncbi:MAG: hypothetical protein NTW50_03420 [Candidatus Berkelbacteria bacterium]|nr:hypothetical protein [Candidatus Berkelbacteria bacterium]
MAYTMIQCANCGRSIKSHFSYCPVCRTSKPFRCYRCNKRISGPLQQGVGIVGNQARCSSCANAAPRPKVVVQQVRVAPKVTRPKPKYGRFFSLSGIRFVDWYSQGYNHAFNDAISGKSHSTASHYTFHVTDEVYRCYSKGYSDGYRAGKS